MSVLALDAGTTGVTALIVSADAQIVARGYSEFPQHFPHRGLGRARAEGGLGGRAHRRAGSARDARAGRRPAHGGRHHEPARDRRPLGPRDARLPRGERSCGRTGVRRACATSCREDGHEPRVAALTGLRLDAYFTATKLAWIALNEPHVWASVTAGRTAVGTVDSYLVARMTRGLHHVTDASNASRTLLYDIHAGAWSQELCDVFHVPIDALPEVVPSYGVIGRTDPSTFLGLDLPIAGIAGDQQAALFGQACYAVGTSKCTYGTGSFVLVNTGARPVASSTGLLTTVAWQHPDGRLEYALEGAVFVTGAAVQWLRDGLQIVASASETEAIARSVPDSGGVVFVPALTGLGAPDWDPHARGTILGISRGTTRAHIVRATLEAIAWEVRDVVDLMVREGGLELAELAVDGGASANGFLCQLQSDALQVPVARAAQLETTGLGAAFLAGLATGVWASQDEIATTVKRDARFEPGPRDDRAHRRWRVAVDRSKSWATL